MCAKLESIQIIIKYLKIINLTIELNKIAIRASSLSREMLLIMT